jgi:tetratricopeptide (TPR) repeat protein
MAARRALLLCLAAACGLAGAAVWAADQPAPAPTIKDLGKRKVDVRVDGPSRGTATRAMDNYRRFLELQNTDPERRAEALRRLGDLSLESGELERLESEVNKVDLGGAEAIRLYGILLKAYPDYARNDQVLYQLARAYETTGQVEQALATLDTIVRRYPMTKEIGEVQFRRGEILFSAQRYREAEAAYAIVVGQGGTGSFYQQSLYKEGWSLFKQSLNEESLPVFAKLLDLKLLDRNRPGTMIRLEGLGRADREIVDDTLRVMSVTFSYLDGTKPLDDFITRLGNPPYAALLYSRLGDLFVEKQRFQDAAATYRAFVNREPNNEFSPGLASQAIEAYRKGGFAQLVLEGKRDFVEHYNFDAPFWNGRDRKRYATVVAELKTNLADVAAYYHATAQKTHRAEDYQQAARWYRAQLASFPEDPESAHTNYLLADALFEGGQFADAVTEYERSAYSYPAGQDSPRAAYAALSAYQKREEQLPASEKGAWHRRAIESGVKFAQAYPAHADSAGVLTRGAQDLYAAKDLPRAMEVAGILLARTPPADAAQRRIAYSIIGQSSFDTAAYERAEAAWSSARELTKPGDAERKMLDEQLAAAVYKQAEAKRSAGDNEAAAKDFLRVADVSPNSPIRVTAQYDAAAALISLKQWPRAIEVLEAYRRDYPKSELQGEVTQKLAVAYAEAGRPALAAAEYERIAARPGETAAVREEALATAADLQEKSGDTARTVALLERLVSEFPTPLPERIETRQRLANIAAAAGNKDREAYWQREIVKVDAQAGSARTDRTRYLAAHAQLALAHPARDAFRGVRLVAPLKATLAAKRKALETALAGYKEAAAYNVAEVTTSANFEMAELYRRLAADLLASERPKGLNADELEQYDLLLEEQAIPFEEQAIKLHEANFALANDGLFDDGVRGSYEALVKLVPGRYAKNEVRGKYLKVLQLPQAGEGAPQPAQASAAQSQLEEAILLASTGKTTDAELAFKQLAAENPTLAGPSYNLGLMLRLVNRAEDSATALREAAERSPRSALAWNELGVSLREAGHFPEAAAAYQQAVTVAPDLAVAWRNQGVLQDLYLSDPAAALSSFERYKALAADDKAVGGWIAELRHRVEKTAVPKQATAAQSGGSP